MKMYYSELGGYEEAPGGKYNSGGGLSDGARIQSSAAGRTQGSAGVAVVQGQAPYHDL